MATIHRGNIFHIGGSPLVLEAAEHLAHFEDGALVIDDAGLISWCGDWTELPSEHAGASVVDHHGAFLLPGFIDTHMHFPQVWNGDSYGGGQLLEWLNSCIFPGEARLEDPEFAHWAAKSSESLHSNSSRSYLASVFLSPVRLWAILASCTTNTEAAASTSPPT